MSVRFVCAKGVEWEVTFIGLQGFVEGFAAFLFAGFEFLFEPFGVDFFLCREPCFVALGRFLVRAARDKARCHLGP